MDVSSETLKAQLMSVGLYREFACSYCDERDIFVSGPHSHVCAKCGGHAVRGWYTVALCESCGHSGAFPDWDKLLKNLEFASNEVAKLD